MPCEHGCDFTDGVHDFGCPGRKTVYEHPILAHLYLTETPAEAEVLDRAVQKLLEAAGMAEWDPEQVTGDELAWIAARAAIRAGLAEHNELPVQIVWGAKAEAPYLVMREG